MPVDARPHRPHPLPGTVTLHRVYRDALGRPMTGTVTLTGRRRHTLGGNVVPTAPVTVPVDGGVLHVFLPPDTYTVVAALRTADGARVQDTETIVLEES